MSDHLSAEAMTALVDGELSAAELAAAKAHIDDCLSCANHAVNEWLLKSAATKSGHRFEAPDGFKERMANVIAGGIARSHGSKSTKSSPRRTAWTVAAAWSAAVLIFAFGAWEIVQFRIRSSDALQLERAALATEATDLHIATLAVNEPEVISSDRHTVKPWFQGKLPFSFNIPESLPESVTLDGANLAYLHDLPVAQLVFSIGRHRASVLIEQRNGAESLSSFEMSNAGFHVDVIDANELEVIAVSDVDPGRLEALAASVKDAQMRP